MSRVKNDIIDFENRVFRDVEKIDMQDVRKIAILYCFFSELSSCNFEIQRVLNVLNQKYVNERAYLPFMEANNSYENFIKDHNYSNYEINLAYALLKKPVENSLIIPADFDFFSKALFFYSLNSASFKMKIKSLLSVYFSALIAIT